MLFPLDERSAAVDAMHASTAIYTSLDVVDQILDRIGWPNGNTRLLDPSSGDGAFLVQALARLTLAPGDHQTASRVQGWEIHPGAVQEARGRVAEHLQDRGWSALDAALAAGRIVREADFLVDALPVATFDLIAGNPPYLRATNLPPHFRELYDRTQSRYARGDLLHSFLDRCCQALPDHGIIALVTADRWLFNEGCADLREALGTRLHLAHVGRLDPATSFYRPKFRRAGQPPRIHPIEVLLRPGPGAGAIALTRAPISPDQTPPGPLDVTGRPLGEVATVRLGPYIGPAGIFNIDAVTAQRLAAVGADVVPIVDASNIARIQDRLIPPTRFAIRTRPDIEPPAAVLAHITETRRNMPPRGRRRCLWLPPETITLPLDQEMLMIPRIARRLRVIRLPAGVLPIDHGITVVSATHGPDLDALADAILSEACQDWMRRHAPRLENGHLSITTKILRAMPVVIP